MALLDLDRDQYVAFTREIGDRRSIRGRNDNLATRGERLALTRYRVELTDDDIGPSELEFVTVAEVDEQASARLRPLRHRRPRRRLRELDARWVAGGRSTAAVAARTSAALDRAIGPPWPRSWPAFVGQITGW